MDFQFTLEVNQSIQTPKSCGLSKFSIILKVTLLSNLLLTHDFFSTARSLKSFVVFCKTFRCLDTLCFLSCLQLN